MRALPHPQQADRLDALYGYRILDTPREEDFDGIVRLAARICESPISVVNLIDVDRQWFKAEVGLGVRETPIETSICSHVILEDDFVEIPDTLADRRMRDNPLCLGEPRLRFYAGALLKTPEGLPIGTLCVLDYQPRALTPDQRDALGVLARQVMRELELRQALSEQELLRREVDHRVKNSLQMVSALVRIQSRALGPGEARAALEATEGRIETIAALHRELHEADTTGEIELARFMDRIAHLLRDTVPSAVRLDIDVDPARVGAQQASAIAVIVNEFVANSVRHGFAGGRAGVIRVTGRRSAAGVWHILCEHDGLGASGEAHAPGIGMKIIAASVRQLDGTLSEGPTASGYRLAIEFPGIRPD
jgi:two-component sensor histidine kinase